MKMELEIYWVSFLRTRLLVFENSVLRRICVPERERERERERENGTGSCRKLHKGFYSLYSVKEDINIKKGEMGGARSTYEVINREISSSHGGEYEVQICLLGCTAV
jgi:hypothetical protein